MLLNPAPHDGDFGAAPPVQPVQSQTEQALDRWGNVLWSKQYDYVAVGQNPTLRRTYNNAYLATSPYTARYIFNRLVSTTLTDATTGQDKISHPSGGSRATPFAP
jgi:hypothetical protein